MDVLPPDGLLTCDEDGLRYAGADADGLPEADDDGLETAVGRVADDGLETTVCRVVDEVLDTVLLLLLTVEPARLTVLPTLMPPLTVPPLVRTEVLPPLEATALPASA